MPLYEYKCDRCGSIFEVMQKFSDTPLELHENCGGHLEKLLSAAALQFKGTGWYVTDYARKSGNGKAASKNESKDTATKPAKTDSSDSAKPASGSSTPEKK